MSKGEPRNDAPLVSVVLPCYNAHQHLAQTIASIRSQTLTDYEIVLVDDGSDDPATLAFLETLEPDIRLIRQENRGLSAARNAGFKVSQGRYVLPLDCDDWIDRTFLEEAVGVLNANDDIAFAFSFIALEGELSGLLQKRYNFFEQLFTNQLPYCILVRRSAWLYAGGYDETMLRGLEDWEFNLRLGSRGLHGLAVEKPLFHYRVRSQGMLRSLSLTTFSALYRILRQKHAELYSFSSLVRTWFVWRSKPYIYPLPVLVLWLLANQMLPNSAVDRIFRILSVFSEANRSARRSRKKALAHEPSV